MSQLIPAREADVRAILRIRAVEETDPEGRSLPEVERRRASEAARAQGAQGWRYLVVRARALEAFLGAAAPRLPGDRFRAWLPPVVLVGALLLGLSTALVGPERRINLLSLPLFGILLWNVGLYLYWLLAPLIRGSRAVRPLPTGRLPWVRGAAGQGPQARLAHLWGTVAAPLEVARLRRLLHLAATTVAVGTVAGMYLRGVAFAYEVTWESTFLGAEPVARLLGGILGPAAWVSGIAVPAVAQVQAPASGPAAAWIHLFAITLLLAVALPRLLLMGWQSVRVWRRSRRWPIDLSAAYYRRRLAEGRGEAEVVRVVPYSFQPTAAARDALRSLLVEHLGSRTEVRTGQPLEYGQSLGGMEDDDSRPLLLFALNHTPEREVHGELLRTLVPRLEPQARWAVVEEGGFGGDAARREGRRRLWQRVCREAGFGLLAADLAGEPAEALYDRLVEVAESCRASN